MLSVDRGSPTSGLMMAFDEVGIGAKGSLWCFSKLRNNYVGSSSTGKAKSSFSRNKGIEWGVTV